MAETNPTIRESIIKSILGEILSGRLNPGDKLPSEREIANRQGISRSIVHLALEELSHAGFIEVRPRSSNIVADFINNGNLSTLAMLSKIDAGKYQQQYREAMVETRNALECQALIDLAGHGKKTDFDTLNEIMAEMKTISENTTDISYVAEKIKKYHMTIIRLGGNFISTMIMNSFYDNSTALWERCVSFWGIETTVKLNEKILCLVKEGKGQEASDIINDMFSKYREANAT